jgi:acyl carrier protein
MPKEKKSSTAEKVRTIVADALCIDETDLTDEPFAELGADSLDHVELIMGIEEAFDLDIPDDDADRLRNLSTLTEYVERKAGKS